MELWRRNLYVIAVSEFVAILGFHTVLPFMPLFIQEIGNFTNQEAALWVGIAAGSGGVTMFLSAPLWGIVADRWGRKPMVLRSQFGSAIVLALSGLSPNVYYFIGLRLMLGILSGTVAAASALVSTMTPRDKISFAMGLLMVAVFGGSTFGPLIGGLLADAVGFRATFFITGALLFLSGLMVLLLVRETFERPPAGQVAALSDVLRLVLSKEMLPLLLVIGALNIAPQMVAPIIPLIIKEVSYEGSVASASGLAFALLGLITAISSYVVGRLSGRIDLKKILIFSCVGTGLLYLPPIWAQTVTQLVVFVGITGLLVGGVLTSSNALVALSVPLSQQGVAYGLTSSAISLAIGVGPMLGGILASFTALRSVFGVAAGLFFVTSILARYLLKK